MIIVLTGKVNNENMYFSSAHLKSPDSPAKNPHSTAYARPHAVHDRTLLPLPTTHLLAHPALALCADYRAAIHAKAENDIPKITQIALGWDRDSDFYTKNHTNCAQTGMG